MVAAALYSLTGRRWLSFERLETEAKQLQSAVAAGTATWPPRALGHLSAFKRGAKSAGMSCQPTSGFAAAQMPSMRAIVADALAAAAATPDWTPLMRQRLAEALTTTYHSLLMWRTFGRRVWLVDPEFAHRLLWSELPEFPGHGLEAPLSSLYLVLPRGLTMPDPVAAGTRHDVEGALVTMDSGEADGERRRELRITLFASRGRALAAHSLRSLGSDVTLTAVTALDGATIGRVAKEADAQLSGVRVPPAILGSEPSQTDDRTRRSPGGVGHLVLALLCFAMEHRDDAVRVRPRRAESLARGASAPPERHIGVFVIGRRYLEAHPSSPARRGSPLRFPTLVAGHYRWVPYGPGGVKRRLTRIKQYRKGPGTKRIKTTAQRLGGAAGKRRRRAT